MFDFLYTEAFWFGMFAGQWLTVLVYAVAMWLTRGGGK